MSASDDEVAVTASIIETSDKAREQGLSALTCGIRNSPLQILLNFLY
ncbi:hypothetical protein [Pseudomonas tructae]|nr:hypothetical protein [Pseudomonas tructae]